MTAATGTHPTLQRARGVARIGFSRRSGVTRTSDLFQSGCARVRFPGVEPGTPHEAVLINTAGGLADGDCLKTHGDWGTGATAAVTTQACERICRSRGGPARMEAAIEVATGGTALWLPQEAILFGGARMARDVTIDMAADATLVACESSVLGRTAMGEDVTARSLRENWRSRNTGNG